MAENLEHGTRRAMRKADAEPDLDTLREGVRVMTSADELESSPTSGCRADISGALTGRVSATATEIGIGIPAGYARAAGPTCTDGSFFPGLLEPRKRAERALVATVREAYVQGVSTRRVDDLVKASA